MVGNVSVFTASGKKMVHVLISSPRGPGYCELREQFFDGRTRDGSVNGLDINPRGINLIPLEVPAWLYAAISVPSLNTCSGVKDSY